MSNNNLELIATNLIVRSGTARSISFEALQLAKKGKIEEAQAMIQEAIKNIQEAHNIQTDLIQQEASGSKVELNLLMVHAQDHLMTSILAKDLITEIIDILNKK